MTAAQAVSLSRRSKADGGRRLHLLDLIRGITLLSMIAYHGSYDLVYHYGLPIPGYTGLPGYLWQQSICWTFLFLSGFCFSLGRPVRGHQFRRCLLYTSVRFTIQAAVPSASPLPPQSAHSCLAALARYSSLIYIPLCPSFSSVFLFFSIIAHSAALMKILHRAFCFFYGDRICLPA